MQVLREGVTRRRWHPWGWNGADVCAITDLLQQLPDDYYLVSDLTVKGSGATIEHVVVGPCGLVVIETKRWAGNVRCDGDRWSVNGWPRPSVSRQLDREAAALRRWLADLHPDIYSARAFIQSLAVFTHPGCRLDIDGAESAAVRCSELLHVLHEKGRERRMPPVVASRLAESLAGIHAPSVRSGSGRGGDES